MSDEPKELRVLSSSQEAYRKGKLPWQAKAALANKEVRQFLIANPQGVTKEEIAASCKLGGSITRLQQMGLAYFTGGGKKGPTKWFAKSM